MAFCVCHILEQPREFLIIISSCCNNIDRFCEICNWIIKSKLGITE